MALQEKERRAEMRYVAAVVFFGALPHNIS
jgi:hypothetical protein